MYKKHYFDLIQEKLGVPTDDLRKHAPREVNSKGQHKGPTVEMVIECAVKAWQSMPMAYLAYSFVERKYYSLPDVAKGMGIELDKTEEAKGELYEELVRSVDSEGLHSKGFITNVWDDLKKAQKNAKRHLKEEHKEAKRAKKRATRRSSTRVSTAGTSGTSGSMRTSDSRLSS